MRETKGLGEVHNKIAEERTLFYGDPAISHFAIGLASASVLFQRYHWLYGACEANGVKPAEFIPNELQALLFAAFKTARASRPIYRDDSYDDGHVYLGFSQSWREEAVAEQRRQDDLDSPQDYVNEFGPTAQGNPLPDTVILTKDEVERARSAQISEDNIKNDPRYVRSLLGTWQPANDKQAEGRFERPGGKQGFFDPKGGVLGRGKDAGYGFNKEARILCRHNSFERGTATGPEACDRGHMFCDKIVASAGTRPSLDVIYEPGMGAPGVPATEIYSPELLKANKRILELLKENEVIRRKAGLVSETTVLEKAVRAKRKYVRRRPVTRRKK